MLTSHELFGFMSPALADDILSFARESDRPTYKATMNGVANALRVRPVYLERQPRTQRHASMVHVLAKPGLDVVAGGLLRAWLVQKHKAMLIDFLNALGIQNNEGVVDDLPESVADDKLKSAVDILLSKYSPEVVTVYLNAFNEMNEANWANLKMMLESDSRLQLGSSA
ncbi:MAG TPA: hypothetical protein VFV23_08150 [Verrucomicrobiae bacterium]|nr:hypothetical protein [Verrucomicrobiae bacterium]